MTSRVPALGPRGEGWVVGQVILFGLIALAGLTSLAANDSMAGWGAVPFIIGLILFGVGGILAVRGLWDLRAVLSPFPRPVDGGALVATGAYHLVRHPIYSGVVLAAIGWGLVTASLGALALAGVLFLVFLGKSIREETWLAATYPGYRDYQRRTKRLIPWVL